MATLSEYAASLETSPYAAFRQGGMESQKYDIEQQKLDIKQQAMKDAQTDLASQAKPAGAQAGTPLAGMAKSMLPPGTQLETPDGIPTASGIFQQGLIQSQQEQAEGQRLLKKAKLYEAMDEGDLAIKTESEARRLLDKSLATKTSGFEKYKVSVDDGLSSAYGANSQSEYMQRVKDATERTGIPKPAWLPDTWTPDVKKLILSKMSQEQRQKITKQEEDANYKKLLETNLILNINKKTAAERDDIGTSSPIETKGQIESFINKVNNKANKADKISTGVGRTVLEQIDPEYRSDLDTSKGIKDVGNKISVARGAYEISDFIREKGIKTGKVGEIKKAIDSLGLKDPDAELDPNVIYKAINNQELAKKVIDFANAYARAESGRNIATVAEFKTAMKTFGESSMSGKSAEYVFKNIGDQKVKQIENDYFGGNKAVTVKGHEPKKPESITVGDKTYSRPAGMSDADWSEYQKDVGAKPKEAKQ
jgi:hypothetical protein